VNINLFINIETGRPKNIGRPVSFLQATNTTANKKRASQKRSPACFPQTATGFGFDLAKCRIPDYNSFVVSVLFEA
jgi:hypothetical protein